VTAVIEGVSDHEQHHVCDSEIDQVPTAESPDAVLVGPVIVWLSTSARIAIVIAAMNDVRALATYCAPVVSLARCQFSARPSGCVRRRRP
jgi:hypothetical protein